MFVTVTRVNDLKVVSINADHIVSLEDVKYIGGGGRTLITDVNGIQYKWECPKDMFLKKINQHTEREL